jgi:hypothetical protein
MVLPSEPEFEQARNELAISIAPFLAKHPEYERAFEIVQVSKETLPRYATIESDCYYRCQSVSSSSALSGKTMRESLT